jgi:predicted  nucleic acid-binding Zn-ribbon protein
MQAIFLAFQNDSTLMLIVSMGIVSLLVILLMMVLSAMKIRTYKENFDLLKEENDENHDYIEALKVQLEGLQSTNQSHEKTLEVFSDTKETLEKTENALATLQEEYTVLTKELSNLKGVLEETQTTYNTLQEEHLKIKEHHDTLIEENNKHRTNNARLLMKLESEERLVRELRAGQGK